MLPETPVTKPESDGYIVHWAQYWCITEQRVLGMPVGAEGRRLAMREHEQAKQNLRTSCGLAKTEAHHG